MEKHSQMLYDSRKGRDQVLRIESSCSVLSKHKSAKRLKPDIPAQPFSVVEHYLPSLPGKQSISCHFLPLHLRPYVRLRLDQSNIPTEGNSSAVLWDGELSLTTKLLE